MCFINPVPLAEDAMQNDTTTYLTKVRGNWSLAFGGSKMRTKAQMQLKEGNARILVHYETASVRTTEPQAGSGGGGTPITANNAYGTDDFDISGITTKLWIRPVVQMSASEAAASACRANLEAWSNTNARIVATQSLHLGPTTI